MSSFFNALVEPLLERPGRGARSGSAAAGAPNFNPIGVRFYPYCSKRSSMQLRTVLGFRGNAALATLALASAIVSVTSLFNAAGALVAYARLGRRIVF